MFIDLIDHTYIILDILTVLSVRVSANDFVWISATKGDNKHH